MVELIGISQYDLWQDIWDHCARILSCFSPKASVWLTGWLVFQLFSPSFFTMLQTRLGLPHPLIASISQCVCTHFINVTSVHLLCCVHGNECTCTHDAIYDTFNAIAQNVDFHVGRNTFTFVSFNHIPLLLSMNWHCVHQRWNLHPNWYCLCWSNTNIFTLLILCNSKICCLQSNSSQKKKLSQPTPHWSFPPFNNWSLWMSRQTSWCVFTWLCQCHVALQKAKRPSSFCLGYFFSSKNLNYITKDTSILHLKLGDSDRSSYFPTSTPSRCTPHHHG